MDVIYIIFYKLNFLSNYLWLVLAFQNCSAPASPRLGWRSPWPDSKSAAIKLSQFRVTCLIFPSTLRNDVARHVSMTPKKCQRCIVIMGRRRRPAVGVPRGIRHFFGAPAKQGRLYAAPAKLCRSHPSHDFII